MNQKLLQLFRTLSNQNFVDTFTFHDVIYNKEATQEDKDAFIAWTNDHGLKMIQGRGMYVFATEEKSMITKEDLSEMMYYDENEEEILIPIKKIMHEELEMLYSSKFDSNYPSGWLLPNGELLECDWGDHEKFAGEYIRENNLLDEQREFEKEYSTYYCKDYVIMRKHWVLLDCPSGNCQLHVTFRKHKITKIQREYLLNYFLTFKDTENMDKLTV